MSTSAVPLRLEFPVHFHRGERGKKSLRAGKPSHRRSEGDQGRIPRVARLLALAHHLDGLIRRGEVRDQADIARLTSLTRARVTQIMNLLHLSPEIQEEILFLSPMDRGRDPLVERNFRFIVGIPEWRKQKEAWAKLRPF